MSDNILQYILMLLFYNVINRQLVKDDFKESRMREIADALDLELIIELRPKTPCGV